MTKQEIIDGVRDQIITSAEITDSELGDPTPEADSKAIDDTVKIVLVGLEPWLDTMAIGANVTVPGGIVIGGLSRVFRFSIERTADIEGVKHYGFF